MKTEIIQDIGYGLIPRNIMRDKDISIQAKAVYSYLASFAGNTGRAFPSVSLMLAELGISKDTFYKYRDELENKGAIRIKQERTKGVFGRNIYYLNNKVKTPCPKSSDTVKPDTVSSDTKSWDSNSNNLNSNNLNSNNYNTSDDDSWKKLLNAFEDNGFGLITPNTSDRLKHLSNDYSSKWVLEALEIAIDNNKRNLAYVNGILKKWKSEGKNASKPKQKGNPYAGWEVY